MRSIKSSDDAAAHLTYHGVRGVEKLGLRSHFPNTLASRTQYDERGLSADGYPCMRDDDSGIHEWLGIQNARKSPANRSAVFQERGSCKILTGRSTSTERTMLHSALSHLGYCATGSCTSMVRRRIRRRQGVIGTVFEEPLTGFNGSSLASHW